MNKEIKPNFFMIDFTTQCNCNCIYCLRHFENAGKAIDGKVLNDICEFIISYCKKNNIDQIGFQPWGGEPLIEIDKIIQSYNLFKEAGIKAHYSIQTNGLLLNPKLYDILNNNGISFGISIDGKAASHDAHRVDVRGNKTHERLVKIIQSIKEHESNADLCSISVNSRYTLDHIEENIEYLIEVLGIEHLKFNLVHPNGKDFDFNMLITTSQIEDYITKVMSGILKEIKAGYNCTEANIASKLLNILNRPDDNLCNSCGCCGGYKFISFDQEGNIYPCEMIGQEEHRIGSIYEGRDLIDLIIEASNHLPYFKEKKGEQCEECPYWFYCRGGCKVSSLAYGKCAWEIDDIECKVNRILYPKIIQLLLNDPSVASTIISDRISISKVHSM